MSGDSPYWWADHNNLATLWAWLDERGETPSDGPAYFMEKPWKWETEWFRCKEEIAARR